MLTLSLDYGENFSQSISLNGLLEHEEGMQALSGLVGTGLPPVQVQWLEGAGDGATRRGKRVLSRQIDLPLYMAATSRRVLKELARDLSIALGDTCRLRLSDNEEEFDWIAEVERTGGGDFTYGEDTTGAYDLSLVVTFTAGNPYWVQNRTVRTVGVPTDGTPAILKLNNPGTAPAFPKWTLEGPGLTFTVTSPKGERFVYADLIDVGEKRIIDTEAATVVDQDGVNRYDGVGDAANMFQIPPGRWSIEIGVDQSSDAFIAAQGEGRTNYVTNPGLRTDAAGWTLFEGAYDSGTQTIKKVETTDASTSVCTLVVDGLTPGTTYRAVLGISAGPAPAVPSGGTKLDNGKAAIILSNGNHNQLVLVGANNSGTLDTTFVAADTEIGLVVQSHWLAYKGSGGTEHEKEGAITVHGLAFVGEPGPIFDGETTDADGITYAWAGDANASISKAVATLTEDDLDSVLVTCDMRPRDWMVV